jgi:hypothetical protein
MHLPDHFAVYEQENNTFQLLKLERSDAGEITAIVPWSMPHTALTHPYTNRRWEATTTDTERAEMLPWFRGHEWYIMPTGHNHTHFHKVEVDGRLYTWWSLHHRLYWSNSRMYTDMLDGKTDEWSECPTIPIVEFAYKRVLPHRSLSVFPNWSEVNNQSFQEVNARCWNEYLGYMSTHVDPKDLRIQTPTNDGLESGSCSETDTEERVTRAPRFRFGTPSVQAHTPNGDEEDDNRNAISNFCAYMIITVLFTSFVSLYAFIILSVFETRPQ